MQEEQPRSEGSQPNSTEGGTAPTPPKPTFARSIDSEMFGKSREGSDSQQQTIFSPSELEYLRSRYNKNKDNKEHDLFTKDGLLNLHKNTQEQREENGKQEQDQRASSASSKEGKSQSKAGESKDEDVASAFVIPTVAYTEMIDEMQGKRDNYYDDDEDDEDYDGESLAILSIPVLMTRFGWSLMEAPMYTITTLRQIEYSPSESFLRKKGINTTPKVEDEEQEKLKEARVRSDYDINEVTNKAQMTDEEFLAARFQATYGADGSSSPNMSPNMSSQSTGNENLVVDKYGYIVQQSFDSTDPTCPSYRLSVPKKKGSFAMMKAIYYAEHEGFLSLFKGATYGFMETVFQDYLDVRSVYLLNAILPKFVFAWDKTNIGKLVFSMFASGWITTPLDYLRTKTILKSKSEPEKKSFFGNIVEAVTQVSFSTVSLLKGGSYVIELFSTTLVEAFMLRISQGGDILACLNGALFVAVLDAVILTPLVTVRQRLLAQTAVMSKKSKTNDLTRKIRRYLSNAGIGTMTPERRNSSTNQFTKSRNSSTSSLDELEKLGLYDNDDNNMNYVTCKEVFKPIVQLPTVPYNGVQDCLKRIWTEEGVGSLYYGFYQRLSMNVFVVFFRLLGSVTIIEDDDF